MVTNLHIANLIYCQGCLNTIFQIIKVGQHVFKHLHKEKELFPQGFFQPFWEGVLGPFALGNFRYFNQNWENFYNHFYMIFLNRDPKTALNHSYSWLSVADSEGVQGVRSSPPFRQNYFIFMGIFIKI